MSATRFGEGEPASQARRFAQACGTRTRSDAVDARILARTGDALGLVPDLPADKDHHILKELRVERMAMIGERTRILNRSKTRTLAMLKRHDEARLAQIKRQLKAVDEVLRKLVRQNPERARP